MEKAKKVQILKEYFEANKSLQLLILCDDGNVFYKEGKNFCNAHCKQNKVKSETVTRQDYIALEKESDEKKKDTEVKVKPGDEKKKDELKSVEKK